VVLPPSGNPIPEALPFSSFNKGGGGGGFTQSDVSDIDYIAIEAQGGDYFGLWNLAHPNRVNKHTSARRLIESDEAPRASMQRGSPSNR